MALKMDVACIKIIQSNRHIKNRYIGNFMYMISCILYSVLFAVSFKYLSFATASIVWVWGGGRWVSPPPPPTHPSFGAGVKGGAG
jgi:hypothetical protein